MQGNCLCFISPHLRPVRGSLSTLCVCSQVISVSNRAARQAKSADSFQSLIRPRPRVAQSWGARRSEQERPIHVSASEREPPWAMTFDLRERETEWTQENKVSCLTVTGVRQTSTGVCMIVCRYLQMNCQKFLSLAFIAFLLVSLHHPTCCETSPVSI